MSIHHQEHDVTLHAGHVLDVLPTLDAASVNCVVTSPPYFGLRDYGVEGQLGLEQSPAEYVAALVAVFRDVRRVLRDDGVVWLNLGDSYYSGKGSPTQPDAKNEARRPPSRILDKPAQDWAKPKDLLGIPWRVAFALQDDGWTLRNSIVWHKPNAMPESVTDRLSTRYETVFLLSKSRRYWFDLDPIKVATTLRAPGNTVENRQQYGGGTGTDNGSRRFGGNPTSTLLDIHETRNPGDVWTIPTSPFPGAHFATMPPALARRCILAGCPDGGTVLDPFTGSGTTGMVARQTGRKFVGIDLNAAYLDLAIQRIGDPVLNFGASA